MQGGPLRLSAGRGRRCCSAQGSRLSGAPRPARRGVVAAYQLVERQPGWCGSEDAPCEAPWTPAGPRHDAREALERLYHSWSPLDWSRGLFLVTEPAGGAGGAAQSGAGSEWRAAAAAAAAAPAARGASGAAAPAPASCPEPARRLVLAAQQAQEQQQQPQPQQQQQPEPPPPQPGGGGDNKKRREPGERSPDYYANVGDAIRTLREDIPLLFDRELNFAIYRDDIVFRDPRNCFQGISNYKTIFWSLRFHGRIFFTKIYVEVKRIWQTEDGCIRMRWTVHGKPRVPWEAEGTFDGISQYKLDNDGRIYEHAVDNVILRDPPVGVLPWLFSINLRPQQQAVPGAFFLPGPGAAAAAAAVAVACGGEGGTSGCAEAGAAVAAAAAAADGPARGQLRPHQQQPLAQQRQAQQQPPQQQQHQLQQPQPQQAVAAGAANPGRWAPLLARFSWVRLYAAMTATVQLLQQHGSGLQLQPAPMQQACAER